jgi:hypothetical protein
MIFYQKKTEYWGKNSLICRLSNSFVSGLVGFFNSSKPLLKAHFFKNLLKFFFPFKAKAILLS